MKIGKKHLEFYCTIPGVDVAMPIIPMIKQPWEWKKTSSKRFQQEKQACPFELVESISNCPGINLLQTQGWLIKTWQDIVIKSPDDKSFTWKTPLDQKSLNGEDYVGFHDEKKFVDFKSWPINSLKVTLKINTGWRAIIPKGYMLLQLPVYYSDNNKFSVIAGCHSPEYGVANFNIPLYWHMVGKEDKIEAGTPLAQLVLIPKTNYNYKIVEPNQKMERIHNIVIFNSFHRNYNKIKQFFSNR